MVKQPNSQQRVENWAAVPEAYKDHKDHKDEIFFSYDKDHKGDFACRDTASDPKCRQENKSRKTDGQIDGANTPRCGSFLPNVLAHNRSCAYIVQFRRNRHTRLSSKCAYRVM